mmetsp:Transcript_27846/g.54844  ORF Transcript_27846/g.54844 Transcript_27846/m.54844 type:complete len:229 (+) Transcript_27846:39-725(+)
MTESSIAEMLAYALGMTSTVLFSLVYFPQMALNYSRKHTDGFSETSMIIKLVGGAFLLVNASFVGEPFPVIAYGLFGLSMYSILLGQIAYYNKRYFLFGWIFLFPLLPLAMAVLFPESMTVTNSFKPLTQIGSHLAQLKMVWDKQTASGVALTSQHINWIGAWFGLYMCYVLQPKNTSTWFLYYNSVFQAGSFYAAVFWFDGTDKFLRGSILTSFLAKKSKVSPLNAM